MRSNPLPEEFYRHFKGNLYQIKCIAWHSETGEPMVIYQAMYGTYKTYARPLTMFMEEVDHVKYPDVTQKYRFEKVELVDTQDIVQNRTDNKAEANHNCTAGYSTQVKDEDVVKKDKEKDAAYLFAKKDVDASGSSYAAEALDPSEIPLDPKIIEFLDARTYDEKLTILSSIHHRLTDDMIDIMSTATDIEVKPGNIEDRYEEFKSCLVTMQHFECNRLH